MQAAAGGTAFQALTTCTGLAPLGNPDMALGGSLFKDANGQTNGLFVSDIFAVVNHAPTGIPLFSFWCSDVVAISIFY